MRGGQNGIGLALTKTGLRTPWWAYPGITEAWHGPYGITESGGRVSAWAPIVGTHAFAQASGANQPSYANGVLTFDGLAYYLQASFALAQPATVFFVGSQVSWTDNDYLLDGVATGALWLKSRNVTPDVSLANQPVSSGMVLGQDRVVAIVLNGASSSLKIGNAAAIAQDMATTAPNGWTIGSAGNGTQCANITCKAFAYAAQAVSADRLTAIMQALAAQYGITL